MNNKLVFWVFLTTLLLILAINHITYGQWARNFELKLQQQTAGIAERMALVKRIELHLSEQNNELERRVEWVKSVEIRLTKLLERHP